MKHLIVLAGIAITLTACGTTVNMTAPSPSPTWNAQQATVTGCRALAAWENNPNSTGTEGNASTSVTVQHIITQSAGTKFSADLTTWVLDTDVNQATVDSQVVDADCAVAGVPNVIGG